MMVRRKSGTFHDIDFGFSLPIFVSVYERGNAVMKALLWKDKGTTGMLSAPQRGLLHSLFLFGSVDASSSQLGARQEQHQDSFSNSSDPNLQHERKVIV